MNIVQYHIATFADSKGGHPYRRLLFGLCGVSGTGFALVYVRRLNVEVENPVLLVEDEAPLRRSLEKFLERAGYAYNSCQTAREALVLAERTRYPIVIIEYHLPDANGIELLKKLKRIVPDVAAIMISEFDLYAHADDLVQANVRSFLQKPFDLVDLENALHSVCSNDGPLFKNVGWNREWFLKAMPVPPFIRVLSEA